MPQHAPAICPLNSTQGCCAREPVQAFVGVGANLGDAAQTVRLAVQALAETPGVSVQKTSRLYRSAPVDAMGPDYCNAVAEVHTTLSAPALLQALQVLEQRFGRERPYRNSPRTLDLDVLLYGSGIMTSPHLVIPHPRMWSRAFVLRPLAEISPEHIPSHIAAAVTDQSIELWTC